MLQHVNNCCHITTKSTFVSTFLLFTGLKATIQACAKLKHFQNTQDNKSTFVTLNQPGRGVQMAMVNQHPLYQNGHGVHRHLHELQQASRMRDDLYVLNKFVRMAARSLNCNLLFTKIWGIIRGKHPLTRYNNILQLLTDICIKVKCIGFFFSLAVCFFILHSTPWWVNGEYII